MTELPSDCQRLQLVDGRELLLVGTAHVSQESVDLVRRLIAEENPDRVCVELDEGRYQSLVHQKRWESLNIYKVIKQGQGPFLLANLALASFQKRMGLHTGVKPGAELAAAAQDAEESGIAVSLIDREIRTTLLRAWRKTGWWKRLSLISTLFASLFEDQKMSEEELARLRESDTLSAMLDEMATMLPSVKRILVDERDLYMAHQLTLAQGEKILAVVGAAHLGGMLKQLPTPLDEATFAEISTLPEKTFASKLVPWLIPTVVLGLFAVGFAAGDYERLTDAAVAWVLTNGLLSALGTIIALGHPLTVLTAFIAAPITSLNPTIGAGFVTGLVQALIAAPTVRDLEQVGDDLANLKGWWSNRVMRVLLVFFFSSLGSAIGTFVAFHWLKDLF